MVTDPIADLLIRLQNGARRRHAMVMIPASKLKAEVLRVLNAEGFIGPFEQDSLDGHAVLKVHLRYIGDGESIITGMRRVSKPGKRVYVGRRNVTQVMSGMGLAILSTSKGLMTDQQSRRASLGGEVLCHVW